MSTDEALFVQRVLRPTRTRLAAMRTALVAYDDPRVAWEALAPPHEPAGLRRIFRCMVCQGNGASGMDVYGNGIRCKRCSGLGATEAPTSMDAVLAMCADPEGLVAAEALSLETARRHAPRHATVPGVVCWYVAPASDWPPHERMSLIAPGVMLSDVLSHNDDPFPTLPGPGALREALCDFYSALCFEEVRRRATPLRDGMCTPATLVDRPLGDLPNPFTPQVELWRLGYGLVGLDASRISIFCPTAEDT